MIELLPLCLEKGIAIVIAGAMNSGILASPSPESHFNYRPAAAPWIEKALRLKEICGRHGVPLRAAALQFVYAHPAVAAVAAGVRTVAHLDDTVAMLQVPIPDGLWDDCVHKGSCRRGTDADGQCRCHEEARVMTVIDAHHHFWDTISTEYDYYWMTDDLAIDPRPIWPRQLRPLLAERGVERTVLVQCLPSKRETEGYLETAAAIDFVAGVVGWVDLTDPGVTEALAQLRIDRTDASSSESATWPRMRPIRTGSPVLRFGAASVRSNERVSHTTSWCGPASCRQLWPSSVASPIVGSSSTISPSPTSPSARWSHGPRA